MNRDGVAQRRGRALRQLLEHTQLVERRDRIHRRIAVRIPHLRDDARVVPSQVVIRDALIREDRQSLANHAGRLAVRIELDVRALEFLHTALDPEHVETPGVDDGFVRPVQKHHRRRRSHGIEFGARGDPPFGEARLARRRAGHDDPLPGWRLPRHASRSSAAAPRRTAWSQCGRRGSARSSARRRRVRVAVDEARQNGPALQVDDRRPGPASLRIRIRAQSRDLPSLTATAWTTVPAASSVRTLPCR